MSGKSSAVTFVSVLAIALAANEAGESSSNGRTVSSLRHGKPALEKPVSALKHTSKLSGPLSSVIELVGAEPAVGDVFVLKGLVTNSSSSGRVEFKWILPPGVEHINGQLSGEIVLEGGKAIETEITLRQVSAENAQVHFQAVGRVGAEQFGNTAQYNTLREREIHASKQELQKSTEDDAIEHQHKVFQ